MSRFVINRKSLCTVATAFAILGGSLAYVPSTAQAADNWGDILKPLVKDVLVPGVKLGVKKWSDRKNGKKDGDDDSSQEFVSGDVPPPPPDWNDASVPPPPTWEDVPPPPVETTASAQGTDSELNGQDTAEPTPEEPRSPEPNEPVASSEEAPPPPPVEEPSSGASSAPEEVPPPPPPPPEA